MQKIKLFVLILLSIGLVACATQPREVHLIKQQVGIVAVGQYMDQQDKINVQYAMITVPMGQKAIWTNKRTRAHYTVTPVRQYKYQGHLCRRAKTIVIMNVQQSYAFTTVCRGPDGKWHVSSE